MGNVDVCHRGPSPQKMNVDRTPLEGVQDGAEGITRLGYVGMRLHLESKAGSV